jgi:hypothetical protein
MSLRNGALTLLALLILLLSPLIVCALVLALGLQALCIVVSWAFRICLILVGFAAALAMFFLSFVFIGSPYVGCQVGGVLVCLQACYYLVAFVLALFGKAVPSVGNHSNFVLPGAAAAGSLS